METIVDEVVSVFRVQNSWKQTIENQIWNKYRTNTEQIQNKYRTNIEQIQNKYIEQTTATCRVYVNMIKKRKSVPLSSSRKATQYESFSSGAGAPTEADNLKN